jgi:hypothetical protein
MDVLVHHLFKFFYALDPFVFNGVWKPARWVPLKSDTSEQKCRARQKMNADFLVPPKSAKEIEIKALDWRYALGVEDAWAPDVIDLFEKKLPKLFPDYTLTVRSDEEMIAIGDAEAYTTFNPPLIAVRDSVYLAAMRTEGRARMTFAHEFGHLVLHPGAAKLRSDGARELVSRLSHSKVLNGKRESLQRIFYCQTISSGSLAPTVN